MPILYPKRLATVLIACTLASVTPAMASQNSSDDNLKVVDHITWHKHGGLSPQALLSQTIPQENVSLFFIRQLDDDGKNTNVNIAINDALQTSLQPGSYTQVLSCAGDNNISAVITGKKTNDLSRDARSYGLDGGKAYFFDVQVNELNIPSLKQMTKESAIEALKAKSYQQHLVSRVHPICQPITSVPQPSMTVVYPEPVPYPVLEEKVSMALRVLFDTDKAIIKPEYTHEVAKVATFMKEYGNTTAVIEGHTDDTASESYNQRLSERRANAIRMMLINDFGIAANRLYAIGYGEQKPVATNATSAGREQNRRVIAVIEER